MGFPQQMEASSSRWPPWSGKRMPWGFGQYSIIFFPRATKNLSLLYFHNHPKVIKPLCGTDSLLLQNLETYFTLQYPKVGQHLFAFYICQNRLHPLLLIDILLGHHCCLLLSASNIRAAAAHLVVKIRNWVSKETDLHWTWFMGELV